MDVNPIQAWVDTLSKGWEEERVKSQMTLGRLIAELESFDPLRSVRGFGVPDSYRGYYSDLAFNPSDEYPTVAVLLGACRYCMGRVFQGYKGGDFAMHENTPLWVASWGSTGERLMGLDTKSDTVRPITETEEW